MEDGQCLEVVRGSQRSCAEEDDEDDADEGAQRMSHRETALPSVTARQFPLVPRNARSVGGPPVEREVR